MDPERPTTLAVVSVDATGERSFSFYRQYGADLNLRREDVPEHLLKEAKILHFGSVSLTDDPSYTTTLSVAREAKAGGALVSYDPNYRASLWKDEKTAIARMLEPLDMVDILKISDEELPLLAGTEDPEEGTARLAERGISLIFLTLGADGVFYRFRGQTGKAAGILREGGGHQRRGRHLLWRCPVPPLQAGLPGRADHAGAGAHRRLCQPGRGPHHQPFRRDSRHAHAGRNGALKRCAANLRDM